MTPRAADRQFAGEKSGKDQKMRFYCVSWWFWAAWGQQGATRGQQMDINMHREATFLTILDHLGQSKDRINRCKKSSFFDKIRPFWHPKAVDLKSQLLIIFLTKISKNLNEIPGDHFLRWSDHFGPSESVSKWFWWCTKKVDFWPFLLCFLGEKGPSEP